MSVLEQEMKLPVPSLADVRLRVQSRGGSPCQPAELEDNWVLDDAAGTLAAGGRLLRVRRFGSKSLLTLKGPASFTAGVKSRVELETEVGDAEALLAILSGLGFAVVRRYQKRREIWALEGVTVALDDTPMGAFVELEGKPERLARVASALELDPRTASRGTYLDLWSAYRSEHPDAPRDMVFATEEAAPTL